MAELGIHPALGQRGTQHPDPYPHQDHMLREEGEIEVLFLEGGRYVYWKQTPSLKSTTIIAHKTDTPVESIGPPSVQEEAETQRGSGPLKIEWRGSGSGSRPSPADSKAPTSHLLLPSPCQGLHSHKLKYSL